MSSADNRQASMDSTQIYREETFTDRKVGTIRCLTPVGALPISFELEASTLSGAVEKFGAAAEQAVQQTMRELQEMRREQASSLVIPDAAGGGLPSPDLLRGGRPRR
jgi:hypothetical protein